MRKYTKILEQDKIKKYKIIIYDTEKINYYLNYLKEKYSEKGTAKDIEFVYSGGTVESYLLSYPWCDEIISGEYSYSHVPDVIHYYGGTNLLTCNVKYKKYPRLYHILADRSDNLFIDLYNYINNNIELEASKDVAVALDYAVGETKYEYDTMIPYEEKIELIKSLISLMKFKLTSEQIITEKNKDKAISDLKKIRDFLNIIYFDHEVKNVGNNYSQYDCELPFDEDLNDYTSTYYDIEHFYSLVNDEVDKLISEEIKNQKRLLIKREIAEIGVKRDNNNL